MRGRGEDIRGCEEVVVKQLRPLLFTTTHCRPLANNHQTSYLKKKQKNLLYALPSAIVVYVGMQMQVQECPIK